MDARGVMLVVGCLAASGCGQPANNVTPDGGQDAGFDGGAPADDAGVDLELDAGRDAGPPNLSIYARGDLTPKTFADGYSGQTPTAQEFGIGRLDLMASPTDTAPVTVFDHGDAPVLVDMLAPTPTLAGTGASASLPAGTYPWGRVQLTLVRTTVAATIHGGSATPGTVTVVSALSDTAVEGVPWAQGRTEYTVKAGVALSVTFPGAAPSFPSTSGGTVAQEAGRTWLVFPFTTPFVIDPEDPAPRAATITYDVYQSFRWQEQSAAGYASGAFDVDPASMSSEPVRNLGATGYHTTP